MGRIKPPKYFTIQENDAGTEAYQDSYVHDLQTEVKRLQRSIYDIRLVAGDEQATISLCDEAIGKDEGKRWT